VTLVLDREIDLARGDVLALPADMPETGVHVSAHLVWMVDDDMVPGRQYIIKLGPKAVVGTITALKHRVDVDTLQHIAARTLHLNEVGRVTVSLLEPIAFDPYEANHATGGFIVIDRLTRMTVGAGMIEHGLRRSSSLSWQVTDVDKQARVARNGHRPAIVWFTGLSGAGKSTISNAVERTLHGLGCQTYLLDGDNVRQGLNRDLGFTEADRVENIRRVAEVARLFVDAGMVTLVSFISPFRAERRMARELVGEGEFFEVFVDTPLAVCEARDPKGLYRRARAGAIPNFTGISSPYEAPEAPELRLDTQGRTAEECAEAVVDLLRRRGVLRLSG
jgi:bifunctional enzyme CysN/CysC